MGESGEVAVARPGGDFQRQRGTRPAHLSGGQDVGQRDHGQGWRGPEDPGSSWMMAATRAAWLSQDGLGPWVRYPQGRGWVGTWQAVQPTARHRPSRPSSLPPQWPADLAPTSVESRASACHACRGPTRIWRASSAAPHAPAAMGWGWPVPTMCHSVEVSVGVGPAGKRRAGPLAEAPKAQAEAVHGHGV